ncbi:hypothetical protein SRHO_G00317540 [Serrasalmus rhombeus]
MCNDMAVGNACHISEATAFYISNQLHSARRHMELIAYWCAGFLHALQKLSASWRLELMSNCVRILGGFCSRVIGNLRRSLRDQDGSVFSQTSIIRRFPTCERLVVLSSPKKWLRSSIVKSQN